MSPSNLRLAAALAALALVLTACGSTTTTPESGTGLAIINVGPDVIQAAWSLGGPNGYSHTGTGDTTVGGLRAGNYTVSWGTATGFTTPANLTLNVADGDTVVFAGNYQGANQQFPDTPDKLMQNFQAMYEGMDLGAFMLMMHPDEQTILQQATIWDFPDVGTTLGMVEEQRIHERMFSRLDVTDPFGVLVPGIQSITFQTFARQGIWGTSPGTDAIPDAQNALYDVVILGDRGGNYSTLKVQGSIRFYVTHRDSVVSGVAMPFYQMLGQRDLTISAKSAGNENATWGGVKALFR